MEQNENLEQEQEQITSFEGKATITVDELCQYLRIGKNSAYEILKRPGFPVLKIGRLKRIPLKALDAWIERELQEVS